MRWACPLDPPMGTAKTMLTVNVEQAPQAKSSFVTPQLSNLLSANYYLVSDFTAIRR